MAWQICAGKWMRVGGPFLWKGGTFKWTCFYHTAPGKGLKASFKYVYYRLFIKLHPTYESCSTPPRTIHPVSVHFSESPCTDNLMWASARSVLHFQSRWYVDSVYSGQRRCANKMLSACVYFIAFVHENEMKHKQLDCTSSLYLLSDRQKALQYVVYNTFTDWGG